MELWLLCNKLCNSLLVFSLDKRDSCGNRERTINPNSMDSTAELEWILNQGKVPVTPCGGPERLQQHQWFTCIVNSHL